MHAASEGKDAIGEVTVRVDFGGSTPTSGKGASTDVVEASGRAYLTPLNLLLRLPHAPSRIDPEIGANVI